MQTMVQIPPGPGPRPVGRRTSARPVGRLGDGVGTDNCAYKSLGNCAMFFDFLDALECDYYLMDAPDSVSETGTERDGRYRLCLRRFVDFFRPYFARGAVAAAGLAQRNPRFPVPVSAEFCERACTR